MGNKYAGFLEEINTTLGQCGAMKKHFSDALNDLDYLKSHLEKRNLRNANINLKRANNAGRRVSQSFDRVKKTIKTIIDDSLISNEDKTKFNNFLQNVKPHESALILDTSYFVGKLGGDVDSLGVQLDLYKKGKQTSEMVLIELNDLIARINKIIAGPSLSLSNVGLLPFMAVLKDLLPLAKKLKEL